MEVIQNNGNRVVLSQNNINNSLTISVASVNGILVLLHLAVYRIEYSDWILVCTDMFMGK
jgi:hypothetical protein